MIKALVFGDIIGKTGRKILEQNLDLLRDQISPDIVLVNGENSAGGFGITQKIYETFTEKLMVSCVTMGNHWHDKKEVYSFYKTAAKMILPANAWNVESEEKGFKVFSLSYDRGQYAVINLLGKTFMHPDNRSPFETLDKILQKIPESIKIRILDFHAEATSEKQAMGHYADGRLSLVYGTHSHVPTADERILSSNTGYTTDIGMTGAFDSVIGIHKEAAIQRFLNGDKKKFEPATQDPWLCAIVSHIDETTGFCHHIERLQWRLEISSELEIVSRNKQQRTGDYEST